MQISKDIISPILSVMGCEDGGIAFAKLNHYFLPELIKLAEEGNELASKSL